MTIEPTQSRQSEPTIGEKSSDGSAKTGGGLSLPNMVGAPVAKLHYLKFYPESWIAEIGLRMCSLAARGLWIDLICHMAKSPEHGVLLTMAGKPITDGQIAAFVGIEPNVVREALRELEDNRVLSRRPDGAIFSRRMVKDHAEYTEQSANGRKGARLKRGGLEGTLEGTPQGTLEATHQGTLQPFVGSRLLVLGSDSEDQDPHEKVGPEFPKALDRPDVRQAWADYMAYRSERKLPVWKGRTIAAKLGEMTEWGPDRAVAALRASIANGWQGVFEPTKNGKPIPVAKPPIPKANDADQARFKAWWRGLASGDREAWAHGRNLTVGIVDNEVNQMRVRVEWVELLKQGANV